MRESGLNPEHARSFQLFADQLMPFRDFVSHVRNQGITIHAHDFQLVELSDLHAVQSLPGLNEAKVVCIGQSQYVFKGADFRAWRDREGLARPWEKYKPALYEEHSLVEELTVLCTLPPHPNIIPRSHFLVVTSQVSQQRIVGFLQPLRKKQTIEEQIVLANKGQQGRRIPLATKAKWCLGMAEGLLHTHRTARTFHMDMKLGNVLVEDDDDDTPRIIDWQQQGMCRATHPPEATLRPGHPKIQKIEDKMRVDKNGKPLVVFAPQPGTWPEGGLREAYMLWKAENPAGIKAAELFMLARTMWHLLEQREETLDATV